MKTRAALLMVMLSLAAASLLAAAADVVDDDTLIRLPSDGSELGLDEGQVVAAEAATKGGSDDDSVHEATPAQETEAEMTKGGDREEEAAPGSRNGGGDADKPTRPWACCNTTVCTKSFPPTCHCLDLVDECAAACKKCEPSVFDPSRLVCNDEYHGDPGPKCHDDVPSAAFSRGSTALAAAAQLLLALGVLLFIQSQY